MSIRSQLTDDEYREFERWVALGPGGLPHSLEGFRTLQRLNKMLRDPRDLSHLQSAIGAPGDTLTLKTLPPRDGARPTVAPFAIPHRQTTQQGGADIRAAEKLVFNTVVTERSGMLEYRTSYLETNNAAIFLKDPAGGNRTVVPDTHGEIGHIHPADGSMHFSLSPSDTREVLEKGWGELHGLAGQIYQPNRRLPATYTMIYAARTEQDLAAIRQILVAAVAYSSLKPGGAK